MRLTIRQKIMAIAVGLIITMALAAVLSTSLTMKVVDRLQDLKNAYVPAYASLARTDIRSLERALTLRRMIIDRLRSPAGSSRFAELRKLFDETGMAMEKEAKDGQALIDLMIAEGVGDPVALTRLEASIDSTLNETRRYLNAEIERLWPVLESGDAGRIDEGLKRIDDLRDDLNDRLEENRRSMRQLLENAVSETEREAERAMLIASVLTVLATTLGLIFAYLVSSGVTRPVHRLLDGTRALESGQLDRPLAVTSRDEIGDLTTAFNHMVEQLRLKERIRETFGKFVDPRIVASMISDDAANAERVERRIVTVFFSDIAGFTSISEELAPGAIVNLLNNYFSAVTAPIRASNGIVDKYMGDGVMAFWSPPFSEGDSHAASACRAALAQQDAVEQLNKELPNILGLRRGTPVLSVRMGLATGEAIVGTMGSATSKTFTVMGDTVNLASRLEGANKIYGTKIIVTAETVALASNEIAFRELDLITVAGKTEPVHIYEVLGDQGCARPARTQASATPSPVASRPTGRRTGPRPSGSSSYAWNSTPRTGLPGHLPGALPSSGKSRHRQGGTESGGLPTNRFCSLRAFAPASDARMWCLNMIPNLKRGGVVLQIEAASWPNSGAIWLPATRSEQSHATSRRRQRQPHRRRAWNASDRHTSVFGTAARTRGPRDETAKRSGPEPGQDYRSVRNAVPAISSVEKSQRRRYSLLLMPFVSKVPGDPHPQVLPVWSPPCR